jgi:hypothetical protein
MKLKIIASTDKELLRRWTSTWGGNVTDGKLDRFWSKQPIDTVTAYRGLSFKNYAAFQASFKTNRGFSSWTTDPKVALNYIDPFYKVGCILKATISGVSVNDALDRLGLPQTYNQAEYVSNYVATLNDVVLLTLSDIMALDIGINGVDSSHQGVNIFKVVNGEFTLLDISPRVKSSDKLLGKQMLKVIT